MADRDPDHKMLCCPACKSVRVQHSCWVYLHTNEVVSEDRDACYCEACEEHFKGCVELPASQTLEWGYPKCDKFYSGETQKPKPGDYIVGNWPGAKPKVGFTASYRLAVNMGPYDLTPGNDLWLAWHNGSMCEVAVGTHWRVMTKEEIMQACMPP